MTTERQTIILRLTLVVLMLFQDVLSVPIVFLPSSNPAKVKKITNGRTSANGSYSYVGRIEYKLEKSPVSGYYSCAGTFVSYAELAKERQFYFITAAHCFRDVNSAKRGSLSRTQKEFNVIDIGMGRIAYGAFRPSSSASTRARNPLSMYLFVDPTVNVIRIKSNFNLSNPFCSSRISIDMAAVELTKTQADQVVLDGGTFISGENYAYVSPFQEDERCTLIGLGGMQTASVATSTDLCKRYMKESGTAGHLCMEMLMLPSGIRPEIEQGDSGGPVVCLRNGKETLMTHIVSGSKSRDRVTGPTAASLRQFLIAVYREGDKYRVSPTRG